MAPLVTDAARVLVEYATSGKGLSDLKDLGGPMRALVIVFSYHHMNTEKVAKVLAKVLDARIRSPQHIDPEGLGEYDLVGFGSGIYGEKHHKSLLDLADGLPQVTDKNAFIFSTSAMMGKQKVAADHSLLREKLQSKGYTIVDEFACKGFNTNSFLRYLGGMNKGRPNEEDLRKAEDFAKDQLIRDEQRDDPLERSRQG
jgi:flavodoxin